MKKCFIKKNQFIVANICWFVLRGENMHSIAWRKRRSHGVDERRKSIEKIKKIFFLLNWLSMLPTNWTWFCCIIFLHISHLYFYLYTIIIHFCYIPHGIWWVCFNIRTKWKCKNKKPTKYLQQIIIKWNLIKRIAKIPKKQLKAK